MGTSFTNYTRGAVGFLFDIICEGRTNVVGAGAPTSGYYGRMRSPTEPGVVQVDLY